MTHSSLKVGLGFGVASGVMTTLGLMVGLYSSTYSQTAVLGGILMIAIADAFSDAAGIHFSEESRGMHTTKEIWLSTIFTFGVKFIVALTFAPAIFILPLQYGILFNIIWSFLLVSSYSFVIAKMHRENPYKAVLEHFILMVVVVVGTYYAGLAIDALV